jgi:hypothetical protein
MKKAFLGTLLLSLLAVGLTPGNAWAQANAIAVSADIPFSFTIENTTLPAGKYEFTRLSSWQFTVTNAAGDTKVVFLTEPTNDVTVSKASELVFDVYGDKYFLSKIYVDGDLGGYYLAKTGAERDYMKQEAVKTQRVPAKKK